MAATNVTLRDDRVEQLDGRVRDGGRNEQRLLDRRLEPAEPVSDEIAQGGRNIQRPARLVDDLAALDASPNLDGEEGIAA